jgi:AraC-like DNA-binding protein
MRDKGTVILFNEDIQKLREISDFIKDNLSLDLSINFLSQKFLIGKSTLRKRFAAYFNQTLHSYILVCRMHEALRLIRSRSVHIGKIAEKVGYKDLSSFTRAFSRYFGHPPMFYLKDTPR